MKLRPMIAAPLGALFFLISVFSANSSQIGSGTNGVVATVHPLATDAAIRVMNQGGTALDAVVAAALTLGVVDGHNSGIGGGCFILIRRANGEFIAIDGRETAPSAASRNMFVRDGRADPRLSQMGPLASAVPGALAAYDHALRHYGKCSLAQLLLPAADLAERGFLINTSYAARLRSQAADLNQFEPSRALFLHPDGTPKRAGELLQQADLARTYRQIAQYGIRWFYHGPFAQWTEDWMRQNGGIVTREDFRRYRIRIREPIRSTYRGYEIVGFPPPSSGGVHVAQILNLVERYELGEFSPRSADFIHLVSEAMKLAFADRAYWLGDPDFTEVPRGLISKTYAAALAQRISKSRTTEVRQHGRPSAGERGMFEKHTTHFCAADAEGNWVACTATINTSFGSKVVIPNTGVLLNNQMDDFSIEPGVPNYFGLVGAEANSVAPGKRPLSSMSPTILLKDGTPRLLLGAAGGPTIISQVVLNLIYCIDHKMALPSALAQPRFHHQWTPDELQVESQIPESTRAELSKLGHNIVVVDSLGATQGLEHHGRFTAAHDPRVQGKAAGW